MRSPFHVSVAFALATSLGCSFVARGPDEYREDTRDLLETRNTQVKSCYDRILQSDPSAAGTVTVNFEVEKKTGTVQNVQVDSARTTAPESLSQCIVSAMDGLQLTPQDQRTGLATYTYEFRSQQSRA